MMEKNEIVTCSICYYKMSDIQTSCKHLYCEDCIKTWLKKSKYCPYCRIEINYDSLFTIESKCSKNKSTEIKRKDSFTVKNSTMWVIIKRSARGL